ncbi:MAG: ATP-binding protein [Pirellulales bacterium]
MPRTRLVWHLFATYMVAVATVMAGCYWLASLQLARLADETQFQQMTTLATGLAGAHSAFPQAGDQRIAQQLVRHLSIPAGMSFELLDGGGERLPDSVLEPGDHADPLDRWPDPERLLTETRAGRVARGSRYDATTGSRVLAVTVPFENDGGDTRIVRVLADTRSADRNLSQSLRRLLVGFFIGSLVAILIGWMIAVRVARPARELARTARRVADGEAGVRMPGAEVAEFATIAAAVAVLRDQLVERGLTIGRQDTQQEAVLDSMIEGVLAVDVRQRIVGLNQAAANLLKLDIDAVIRRPLQEVIRNPDLRRFALRAIDCREPVEDDFVLPGPTDHTIRVRGTALRDPSGEGGAVIVLNDVTELERLERIRRDFVANVSHELKTPIASIKGFVETLLDGAIDDADDARRFLDIVARQADRLEAIIEDLLSLSRIEQSEEIGSLPLEPTMILDVLLAARSDCLPRAADRGVPIEIECSDSLVATVNGPLLEQAVLNLIDNAIKYGGRDTPIRVRASLEPDDKKALTILTITVRDEGCGIESEHLPRLFERFYRIDKGRSRQAGGTGLGLSIVKHIVQAHGGTIAVASELGQGSTFTLRLPG